jgi:hypothetical protein
MKKVKNKEPELFRHRLAEKHPGKTEKKIKTLSMKFSMLHEIIPSVTEYNDKGNLKYFSKLYVEVQPLIKHISDYITENEYRGKDKRVDDLISKTREVEEYLKVLHLRYESLRLPPKSDHLRWWEYSQKGNKEILREMRVNLEEMKTLLQEMKVLFGEPKAVFAVV